MAVTFPASPTLNQVFVSGPRQYKWNGAAWTSLGTTGTVGYPFTTNNRLYGRSTAGSGIGQEIALGSGLSFTGATLNSTGTGYTFTDTTRLYGRSTAGTGPGEEITIGSGLTLAGGQLSASGGGGGGSVIGIEGYAGTSVGATNNVISNTDLSDFNQTSNSCDYTTIISSLGTLPDLGSAASHSIFGATQFGGATSPSYGFYMVALATQEPVFANNYWTGERNSIISSYVNSIVNPPLLPTIDSTFSSSLLATGGVSISRSENVAVIASTMEIVRDGVGDPAVDAVMHTIDNGYKSAVIAAHASTATGTYSLTHGIEAAGIGNSRTYNYNSAVGLDLPNSYTVYNTGANRFDSLFIRETTLGVKTNNSMTYSSFLQPVRLHDFLKGSSTTMLPYHYYVTATVIGVQRYSSRGAVWEVKALFKGSGVDTCTLVNSTVTKVFDSSSAFISSNTGLLVTASATGDNGLGTAAIMARSLESDPVWFYANVTIQAMIYGESA